MEISHIAYVADPQNPTNPHQVHVKLSFADRQNAMAYVAALVGGAVSVSAPAVQPVAAARAARKSEAPPTDVPAQVAKPEPVKAEVVTPPPAKPEPVKEVPKPAKAAAGSDYLAAVAGTTKAREVIEKLIGAGMPKDAAGLVAWCTENKDKVEPLAAIDADVFQARLVRVVDHVVSYA